jgi:hypothetical protein
VPGEGLLSLSTSRFAPSPLSGGDWLFENIRLEFRIVFFSFLSIKYIFLFMGEKRAQTKTARGSQRVLRAVFGL